METNPVQAQHPWGSATAAPGAFLEGGRAVDAGHGWNWLASGFGLFQKRPGVWVLVTLIMAAILIVLALIPLLGGIANSLLMPVLTGGLLLGCRALEEGGEFKVAQLFAGFSHRTGRLVAVGGLSLAGSIVVMLPLLLIAGSYFGLALERDAAVATAEGAGAALLGALISLALLVPLMMALWFAPCLVVFHDVTPMQALIMSFRACLRNLLPFLLYGVIVLVLAFVAAIPLMLGFLVLLPVIVGSVYGGYRDIFFAKA